MNLRQRTLLSVGATLVCLIGGMYVLSSHVLLQNSERLERKESQRSLRRFSDEIDLELAQIHSNAAQWSNWDETYQFVADKNPNFIQSNLKNVQLKLDFMLFLDAKGQIVQSTLLPKNGHLAPPDPEEVRSALGFELPKPRISKDFSGMIALRSGVLLTSVRPILHTSGQGPLRGWTVFGLRLDNNELKQV